MTRRASSTEDHKPDPIGDGLAQLIQIETRIVDSCDRWSDAVRDDPEATAAIDRMRNTSNSHRRTLERRLTATTGRHPPQASEQLSGPPTIGSASEAVRGAAGLALEAALVCEAAYQTARLAYDADTCDLLETQLTDQVSFVVGARRLLPRIVAYELRLLGVECVCGCPMCTIGACGCVHNTLATVEIAWGGEEPARAPGLVLLARPRPGSQLAAAGLQEGDRIFAVDDEAVSSNQEMQLALRRREVGKEARLEVTGSGGERTHVIVRRVG